MTRYGDNKLQHYLKGEYNKQKPIICKVDNEVFVDSKVGFSLCDVVDVYYDEFIYSESVNLVPEYADHVLILKGDERAFEKFREYRHLEQEAAEAAWNNLDWKRAIIIKLEA